MADSDTEWFPSVVDTWLAVLLLALPLIPAATLLWAVLNAGEGAWAAALSIAIMVAIYAGLIYPMRYGLARGHLIIRNGLMRQRIAYDDVISVYPTRNPLSSPALSNNRLAIQYGPGFFKRVMISPARRGEFLDALAERTGLVRDGDSLIRPRDPEL